MAAKLYTGNVEAQSEWTSGHLTDLELLNTYLGGGVQTQAAQLLQTFGGLRGVFVAADRKLRRSATAENPSVERDYASIAARLAAGREIQRRILLKAVERRRVVSSMRLLKFYLATTFADLVREQLRVLYLDAGLRLIRDEVAAEGSICRATVQPREIIRRALELASTSVILVHNHPSGSREFSLQDHRFTRAVEDAARLFEVELHDHLLLVDDEILSWRAGAQTRRR